MKTYLLLLLAAIPVTMQAQTGASALSIEKIMADPQWIGTSPSAPYWSADGQTLYFQWNPEKAPADSLYSLTLKNTTPGKTTAAQRQHIVSAASIRYNNNRSQYVFSQQGDIYLTQTASGQTRRITQTTEAEGNPVFAFGDSRIVFSRGNNLFSWDISSGQLSQLTSFLSGNAPATPAPTAVKQPTAESRLQQDALNNSFILTQRKEKRELADSMEKANPPLKELRSIYLQDKSLSGVSISPDGRFISYRLSKSATGVKNTIVPNYVTASGFTEDIPARSKVGSPQGSQELFVFDTKTDTVYRILTDSIPGIRDLPAYLKDYPEVYAARSKQPALRDVSFQPVSWSPQGNYALLDLRAQDNKDRWLLLLEPATGRQTLLDRQHDEAWIGGPGIYNLGWINEQECWFQSEVSGYSHLYTMNVQTRVSKALTSGNYEVQSARLSNNKKYFYLTTNQVHPGEQHFYRLSITDKKLEQLTTMTGASQVSLSPDEKTLSFLYSYSNKPWELYLQDNKPGARPRQITRLAASPAFSAYAWRDPELIRFTARDGAIVYARLYRADGHDSLEARSGADHTLQADPTRHATTGSRHHSGKAVIFVHGAGYLQNAHRWWSSYFREYMFHNLLADQGYTVLDIDYRGSAGYGRNWRTGIYRHMGGKDLTDQVDGARYLVDSLGVDPGSIGIYGGSYGGFITLMALFTQPGVFKAGAALRSVTDWAHYNHGYTSNILNEPQTDSIAYRRSSPIHFAEGLKDNLLMCHGMVDVNVHFQDIVRLSQRLIELGKDNWELAVYPVEDHGFVEPSSWTDEYKRIYRLFEEQLKK
ncbi:MAG: prolyl oligopeptidase family serine peptidase [Candidatus Pseudobacter hemicellulosilyticus]|uniref:Prolyl oligopeptidase family serine peptidase n=1 Tax=Candidatus Pseudobacter hemicellulosilyticus TaxID=3121375 RepID=A0AAJ5WVB7_9BACT|nr:MAG: prolyl oligopeptidase family serine peptidase [Pseudobacter sp.]